MFLQKFSQNNRHTQKRAIKIKYKEIRMSMSNLSLDYEKRFDILGWLKQCNDKIVHKLLTSSQNILPKF
jgi:hypothetical protein